MSVAEEIQRLTELRDLAHDRVRTLDPLAAGLMAPSRCVTHPQHRVVGWSDVLVLKLIEVIVLD